MKDGTLKRLLKCRTKGAKQENAESFMYRKQRICGSLQDFYISFLFYTFLNLKEGGHVWRVMAIRDPINEKEVKSMSIIYMVVYLFSHKH